MMRMCRLMSWRRERVGVSGKRGVWVAGASHVASWARWFLDEGGMAHVMVVQQGLRSNDPSLSSSLTSITNPSYLTCFLGAGGS
jgi:hypothetical protein